MRRPEPRADFPAENEAMDRSVEKSFLEGPLEDLSFLEGPLEDMDNDMGLASDSGIPPDSVLGEECAHELHSDVAPTSDDMVSTHSYTNAMTQVCLLTAGKCIV